MSKQVALYLEKVYNVKVNRRTFESFDTSAARAWNAASGVFIVSDRVYPVAIANTR